VETAQLRREVAALRQKPGSVSVREKSGAAVAGDPRLCWHRRVATTIWRRSI
jgi:hypothetical protein